MNIVEVTEENIEQQHICCALSASADARRCSAAKKQWMLHQFAEGYHFQKLDAQGKVFIEYTPAQNAWCPIEADGWLFIDCFWVSGQYKGQGIANRLLQTALLYARSQNFLGLVALTAHKKMPFLSDPGYYRHKGFALADTAPPYYQLHALPLAENAPLPCFAPSVYEGGSALGAGFAVYYTNHCPHPGKYVPLLQQVAQRHALPFTAVPITDKKQAQKAPNPFPTYAMFYNGLFVTNEIFSPAKLEKFIAAGCPPTSCLPGY